MTAAEAEENVLSRARELGLMIHFNANIEQTTDGQLRCGWVNTHDVPDTIRILRHDLDRAIQSWLQCLILEAS